MKIFILGMLFVLTSCAHSQMGANGFFASQQAADASANAASQAAQAAQAAQPMHFAPMP